MVGAFTSAYLLEKPRICLHMAGERNYHVFYMMCTAARSKWCPLCAPPAAYSAA